MTDRDADSPQGGVRVLATADQLRAEVTRARSAGKTIGLVPTMGALHEGHLSLVRAAREQCDVTIATIFVNPTQFGPKEDFDKYPRTMQQDIEVLDGAGTDVAFVPDRQTMYPAGFSTYVDPPEVARLWEGQCRPGAFPRRGDRGPEAVPTGSSRHGLLRPKRLSASTRHPVHGRRSGGTHSCPCMSHRARTGRVGDEFTKPLPGRRGALASPGPVAEPVAGSKNGGGRRAGCAADRTADAAAVARGGSRPDRLCSLGRSRYTTTSDPVHSPVVALIAAMVGQTRLIDNLRIDL
jgi:pantoate--beta-alanine ligase